MADRTVKAILKADVSGLVAGMKQAQKATKDFAAEAKTSAGKNKEAWTSTGQGMMLTGGVIAAGLGLAVKSFMDFDAAMSEAQAGTMATGASLGALREAAIDAGAKTQYSATEAAQAITAMGKAGVSTKDILGGGLTGALDLAAAGQLDVATASEIAATAMNQFGLEGKDIPHIADLLAAGAGKAMGSVQDLGGALKFVGPVAKGLGISIEETTGTLAMFAQAGIKGEMGGTSLRGVLGTLTSPSKIVAKQMAELGINVYDASGKFVGLKATAGELQAKLGPLDDATRNAALGQIFGNEQVTAARILYEGGAGAVDKWTKSTNDAGYAARQAAMLTDNLKGDIERLGGSLSSVLIKSGSGANGMLREMTQQLQGAVDLYGSMPAPVQTGATALGAVAGAASLVVGGLLVLAPRIVATKVALESMGRTGQLLSSGLGKAATAGKMLGGPLVIGAVLLGAFAKQAQESKARVDELADSLDAQTGALTESTAAGVNKRLSDDGSLASAREMGVAAGDLTAAYLGNTDAAQRVDAALKAYGLTLAGNADVTAEIEAMDKLKAGYQTGNAEVDAAIAKAKLLAETTAATVDPTTKLTGAQTAAAAAMKAATGPTQEQADAEKELAKAADEAKKKHDALIDSITNFGNVMLTARGDARGYEAAIDAAQAAVKKNGKTLDITTEKGRDNASALDAIATSALKAAQSNLENAEANGTLAAASKDVTRDVNKAREAFITSAMAMGTKTRPEAEKLATQAGLTGARVQGVTNDLIELGKQAPKPKVDVAKAEAEAKIKVLQAKINAIKAKRPILLPADKAAAEAAIKELQKKIDALKAKRSTKLDVEKAKALGDIKILQGKINAIKAKPIPVDVASAKAASNIRVLQTQINAIKAKPTRLPVEKAAATADINALQAKIDAIKAKPTKMQIAKAEADAKIKEHQDKINSLKAKVTKIDVTKAEAAAKITTLQTQMDAIKQGLLPGIDANTAAGKAKIDALQAEINGLRGKVLIVEVRPKGMSPQAWNSWLRTEADGGVVSYFADGAERHIAQIAPAGAMRIWAEPETGGEAYIPLAAEKRTRSKEILQNVAGRFGGQVTFMADGGINSMRFAAGGYAGPRPSSSSAADVGNRPMVHIEHMTVRDEAEAARRITASQQDAAALHNLAGV